MIVQDVINEIRDIDFILITKIEMTRGVVEKVRKVGDSHIKEICPGDTSYVTIEYDLSVGNSNQEAVKAFYEIERDTARARIDIIEVREGTVVFRIKTKSQKKPPPYRSR